MRHEDYQLEELLHRKPILLDKTSIFSQLSKKTILITGAAGSIGSEIARQVINFSPAAIILLDHAETPLYLLSLELQAIAPNAVFYTELASITDDNALNDIFMRHKPEVVYHAAAYKHVQMMEKSPAQAILVNVFGACKVADLAEKHAVNTFVMISTDKAVKPGNVMGASKLLAEKYITALHNRLSTENGGVASTKYLITRFGNVLGSSGSVVPVFKKQISEGGPVTVTHPDITRFFMTIKEACQLVLEAGAMGKGGEIYVFDMGKQVKIIDLVYKMIQMAGLRPEEDIQIRYIGLRPGEKLYEELVSDTGKIMPTHNKSIMISTEEARDHEKLTHELHELKEVLLTNNLLQIVKKMKEIVPEFISANSVFESLDNQQ
ncbi:UDP-N-acetylglucosamine 4,6-dehydratase family protein [Flavobacterium sp. RHBU_24]|uniref:UDP-N-acetylglucosamine 4,6-dehydratase family protein n=1 Tax=Flavobacterium sp. RHBU_24 TaxID=3391185 RepID=UPI003984D0B5